MGQAGNPPQPLHGAGLTSPLPTPDKAVVTPKPVPALPHTKRTLRPPQGGLIPTPRQPHAESHPSPHQYVPGSLSLCPRALTAAVPCPGHHQGDPGGPRPRQSGEGSARIRPAEQCPARARHSTAPPAPSLQGAPGMGTAAWGSPLCSPAGDTAPEVLRGPELDVGSPPYTPAAGTLPELQRAQAVRGAPGPPQCSLGEESPPVATDEVPGQGLPHDVAGNAVDGGGGILPPDLCRVQGVLQVPGGAR
uniref:Uncharacterized protein n=1 Tax=Serinus canaria TaxID=9135 RepID=A0A8C9UGB1_SERCA